MCELKIRRFYSIFIVGMLGDGKGTIRETHSGFAYFSRRSHVPKALLRERGGILPTIDDALDGAGGVDVTAVLLRGLVHGMETRLGRCCWYAVTQ